MLSLGLSLMSLVWPLMTSHWNFVAHHLTQKEFHARLELMNQKQIPDAMIRSVTCGQKCSNLYYFLCKRKIPKSDILKE